MLHVFTVADAAPAQHQPLERVLPNGGRDDTRVARSSGSLNTGRSVPHRPCQTGPAETRTHTEFVQC